MPIKVVVAKDAKEMSKKAAAVIAEVVRKRPHCVLGFATGSTPEGTYAELARMNKEEGLSFARVTTFNLDEYLGLDGDHDQSYRYFMNKNLFEKIDIRLWNTFVPLGVAADPGVGCIAYEQYIKAAGGVDLWLLGIGNNGHIAFNEPGSAPDSRTRIVALDKSTIEANSRFFKSADEVPRYALSAGIGTIKEARKIVLLASGPKKANAVKAAVEGPVTIECPASLLQDHPDTTFIVDAEAASKLSGEK